MKITILTPGRTKDRPMVELIARYSAKLPHYLPAEYIELPESKGSTPEAVKNAESKTILERIKPSDHLLLFDERGKEYTSREFAIFLEGMKQTCPGNLVMVIGGPYGFAPALYSRANSLLSLSRMTFTHEMARVLALEQTYRALSIISGQKYHHD